MIRSKRAMGFLWVALALVFHAWPMVPVAKGQGTRKDDIVFNSRGVPLAGATVRVCAMPASGQPCTPLALIYSDPALTQALANPTTTDGLGNYFFYAAPGKYEIEISGPGISSKQIPNVILPNDPSAPTFSSLSTTGAISAFSLNLTGNLTVNGSTTVIGNLASGTLNLTNQSSPPGPAGSGTVNLYTKTDKRLYYKDDTGAEIGPIANTSGAQTNVTNTFTASQNFDADTHSKGPNPNFDIMRYGGYVATFGSLQTMTCSINSGSTTLSCTSNPDFQNGHGVVVPFAGSLPTLPSAPSPGQVTPVGLTNGSTTYSYQIVLEDYFGGLTAASASGSTTTGAATLGTNTVALTGVSRVSGLDTFTCASNCNILAGSQVQISGFSGGSASSINGTVVVNTTPTGTTFTVLASSFTDYSETASATASVRACNEIFPSGLLTQESTILRSWIYRNGTLVGVSPGQDPFYIDCGQGVAGQPAYVPTSVPSSPQAGYLATTIASGGGTNTMTLANAAGSTASSQTVQHDNSPALKAAWAAAYAAHGGVVLIPVIPGGGLQFFPFNSTLDLSFISNPTASTVKLQLSSVLLNQPWVLAQFSEIEGIPQASTSFQYTPLGTVGGNAHPLFLGNHNTHGGVRISRIKFSANQTGQSSVVLDQNVGGGGQVGFIFDDDGFTSNAASAVVVKGGFDFWFTHGICGVQGAEANVWFAHPCVDFTNASSYLSSAGTQIPGRIYFEKANFQGGVAVQADNLPASNQSPTFTSGATNLFLNGVLHDSNAGPSVRILTGPAFDYGLTLNDVVMSDPMNGLHQPLVEMTGTVNFSGITLENNKGIAVNPTISGGGSVASPVCINNYFLVGCGQTPNHIIAGSNATLDGGIFGAVNGGSMGYLMPTPAAPASCVVSSGGSVPVTAGLQYYIVATDRSPVSFTPFAGMTLVGPPCTVNTTSGNQTVTVTRPTLPLGAAGWLVYRGVPGAIGEANMSICTNPIPASTTTYVDIFSFACGSSPPSTDTAFLSGITSAGMSTGAVSINGEAMTASPRAEQNIFLPGALTSTWTGATWTLDKALTITRVQAQAKTAPAGCTTNAVVRVSDGTTPINVTISAAANDSGAIAQNYAAGATLTVSVQTAAAGCTTSPADVNVIVQHRMQ